MKTPARLFLVLILAFPFVAGCASDRSRNPSALAGELEEGFKERWVSKRVGEILLAGQAKDGIEARRMALREFADKYEYVRGTNRR